MGSRFGNRHRRPTVFAGAAVAIILAACNSSHPTALSTPTPGGTPAVSRAAGSSTGSTPAAGATPTPAGATIPAPKVSGPKPTSSGSSRATPTPGGAQPNFVVIAPPSPATNGQTFAPAPGQTFNVPVNPVISPVYSSPGATPAPAQTTCTNPPAPPTTAQGITGGHMDYVDSSGTAHGPETTFSASTDKELLAVLDLSGLPAGTVITYVQILCSYVVNSQDFTLQGAPPNLFITFKVDPSGPPSFTVGLYRLEFFVNPKQGSSAAFVMDYTMNP